MRSEIGSDGCERRYVTVDGRDWSLTRQPLGDEWHIWEHPADKRRGIIENGHLHPDMGMLDDDNAALLGRVAEAAGLAAKWPPVRDWGGN